MPSVVELDHVTFRWPDHDEDIIAVDELRLDVGEHLFVRGASGSGKTTLLNLLSGIHVPSGGNVRLLETDIAALSPSKRDRFRADHIGVVFQQFNLLPYLSVLENVVAACAFSKRKRDRANQTGGVDETARRLLTSLTLDADLHTAQVAKLSVGQQQRVAVARALIGGPEIVIADEPTSALDADNRDRFLDLLFHEVAAQGCTLIFVSHDPELADRFPRMIELAEGDHQLRSVS